MTTENLTRFKKEHDSFFALVLVNLAFGSIATVFGIQYVVASVLGLTGGQSAVLRVLAGAFAMLSFGLGLSWVVSSRKILKGLKGIRTELDIRREPVTEETLACWIVRMITHYRENRKTIRTMILICTLGGFCFLALGIIGSLEFISIGLSSGAFTLNGSLLVLPVLLALGAAAVSLASSLYFRTFSRAWDLRQGEIERSECELAEKLGWNQQ
jgi:hypothetical protein